MARKFPDLRDYLALYSDGDIPIILRNTRERFLMSVKPNSKAASDTLLPSEIKLLEMDETGNTIFAVCGYMNRVPA